MPEGDKSLDILGIKPLADAALIVVKGGVDGAGAFLGRICLPAAEEFGLLLRDKVSSWRSKNATSIANMAEAMLTESGQGNNLHAHPKIVGRIIDEGSWEDNGTVQSMWAGLLASSCTEDGKSQQNIVYINLLSQISSSQAMLLDHACKSAKKYSSKNGLIQSNNIYLSITEIMDLLGTRDIDQVDVELDHLRGVGLLAFSSGLSADSDEGNITPSPLGLNFYARCHGHIGSVTSFFGVCSTQATDEVPEA